MADSPRKSAPATSGIAWRWWSAGGAAVALGAIAIAVSIVPRPESGTGSVGSLASGADSSRRIPPDSGSAAIVQRVDRVVAEVVGSDPAPVRTGVEQKLANVDPVDDGIRTKGDAPRRLRIYRMDAERSSAQPLRDGDTAMARNILQVGVGAGDAVWGAVVSVDAFGQATLHLPETGDSALLLKDETTAPHSFELDDSRGFERFLLIRSSERFSLDEALSVARRSGRTDPVRKGWTFESVRLAKP